MASDDPARSDGASAVKQALSELIERFPDLRATGDARITVIGEGNK